MPIQPSPSSPTRRYAAGPEPPTQIGNAAPCGGFGSMAMTSAWNASPCCSMRSSPQHARSRRIDSSICRPRRP